MKKKSGGNAVVVIAVAIIVVCGGVLAIAQDWKTGRNGLVDYARAEMGDAELQYQFGQKELKNTSVTADPEKARVWFEKSAKNGYVPAMMTLADTYNKSPAKRDGDAACHWYEEAAKAGNAEAMRNFGLCHQIGRGSIEPNLENANIWFRKAAEKGDLPAQTLLAANLINYGDSAEGLEWLRKADTGGSAEAANMLGDYYYGMYGSERDANKAFSYYAKGAERGNIKAQLSYSYCFFAGRGTAKDGAEAYKWTLIAQKSGKDRSAQSALNFLKPQLTAAQIAEGEKRADAWLATHKR